MPTKTPPRFYLLAAVLWLLATVIIATAQPVTTKPSTSMIVTPCAANAPVMGGGTGDSPGCGPTPTRAGDIMYFNGTTWVSLAGNNSGTQFFQENSSGVPAWATVSGTGTVTSVTCFGTAITTSGTCITTGQIPATATNDSATAGNVGEVIDGSAALASVSLTTATPANITSISLTAGDREVYETCYYSPAASTTITFLQCSSNVTTATIDAAPVNFGEFALNSVAVGASVVSVSPGQPKRYSLSTTTTVYLTTNQTFGTSTLTAGGKIHAIRAR